MKYHVHFRPVEGHDEWSEWLIHEEGSEEIDEDPQGKACWVEADSPAEAKTKAKWALFPDLMAKHQAKLDANPEYQAWLQSRGGVE